MSETFEVAFAADEAYAPHAATLLRSLLTSNPPAHLRAHFLHPPELSATTIDRVGGMVRDAGATIEFHAVPASAVRGLPSMGRIPQVMWYRLLLPRILDGRHRVLYLDADTLAVDDLAPLWQLDLRGSPLGAVTNLLPADLRHRPAELGLTTAGYFNSGVLLIDLDAWRASGCAEDVARLAQEHPERLVFPDQDALNLVFRESWRPLHPRWNAQNSILYYNWAGEVFGDDAVVEARSHPAIVHFEGPAQAKPWHTGSTHPYQAAYLGHRAQTPWPLVRLEGERRPSRLRRSLLGRSRRGSLR